MPHEPLRRGIVVRQCPVQQPAVVLDGNVKRLPHMPIHEPVLCREVEVRLQARGSLRRVAAGLRVIGRGELKATVHRRQAHTHARKGKFRESASEQ